MERLTMTSNKGGVAFTFDLDITCEKTEIQKILKLAQRLKTYEDTGLEPDEIEKLKEKQIPKNVPDIEHFGRCPECDTEFNSELLNEYNIMFCPWCGQALNWTEN